MGPEMIPIFGMVTGVLTTGLFFWGLVMLARSQIGTAIARWIQSHAKGDPEMVGELLQLREQVEMMQQQLFETQERVDFTERLLARAPRAPSGTGPD
ncbi:MAG TPA: hypothetical protein VNH46_05500 [Gemmatimonadales bacterium]|nr:hypothetical protein [Gemmatimonadales bacterium]